jgi:hypothetical protein
MELDLQLEQLQREAGRLRTPIPGRSREEGNLFGQLEQTPRNAVSTAGGPAAAANTTEFRAARAGTSTQTRLGSPSMVGLDAVLPQEQSYSADNRVPVEAPRRPVSVSATRGEAFSDTNASRLQNSAALARSRAEKVRAGQMSVVAAPTSASEMRRQAAGQAAAIMDYQQSALDAGARELPSPSPSARPGLEGFLQAAQANVTAPIEDPMVNRTMRPAPELLRRLAAIGRR